MEVKNLAYSANSRVTDYWTRVTEKNFSQNFCVL